MVYICDICGSKFKARFNMLAHKKKAKYCLALQNSDSKCEGCAELFKSKTFLEEHMQICVPYLHLRIIRLEGENYVLIEENRSLEERRNEEIEALSEENSELKLKMVETGTGRDIYRDEYHAIRDKPTTSSTSNTYTNNSINQKLGAINISTIEPFTLETVRSRLEAGAYSYEAFLQGIEGVQRFILDIITKDDEKSYATTDISRSNFHRLEDTRQWVGDKGALFITKAFDAMNPYAMEHFNNLQAQNRQASAAHDIAKLEELDAIREHTKDSLAGIIHPNSPQRKELLADVIRYVKPHVAV